MAMVATIFTIIVATFGIGSATMCLRLKGCAGEGKKDQGLQCVHRYACAARLSCFTLGQCDVQAP